MPAAAGGRGAVSAQDTRHAPLANFVASAGGQPLFHLSLERACSTRRPQRHFQNFWHSQLGPRARKRAGTSVITQRRINGQFGVLSRRLVTSCVRRSGKPEKGNS